MEILNFQKRLILAVLILVLYPRLSAAWHNETHLAIAKAAGYSKWYCAIGADMAKIKAGDIESHNHFVNNPSGTVVTPEMVLGQVEK